MYRKYRFREGTLKGAIRITSEEITGFSDYVENSDKKTIERLYNIYFNLLVALMTEHSVGHTNVMVYTLIWIIDVWRNKDAFLVAVIEWELSLEVAIDNISFYKKNAERKQELDELMRLLVETFRGIDGDTQCAIEN
jgi:hypothetical protein